MVWLFSTVTIDLLRSDDGWMSGNWKTQDSSKLKLRDWYSLTQETHGTIHVEDAQSFPISSSLASNGGHQEEILLGMYVSGKEVQYWARVTGCQRKINYFHFGLYHKFLCPAVRDKNSNDLLTGTVMGNLKPSDWMWKIMLTPFPRWVFRSNSCVKCIRLIWQVCVYVLPFTKHKY